MVKRTLINLSGQDFKIEGKLICIARLDGDEFTFPDDPELVLYDLLNGGIKVDLFTFLEKLPVTSPNYSFPMELDNLAVLPVSTFDEWWAKQIHRSVRVKVRKAEKNGVVVREVPFDDSLLQGICEIYNESPVRHGKRFPHYGMKIDMAREYAGTFLDRSTFIGAFVGDSLIGFIKIVSDETRSQACLLHILSMMKHRDKSPTNALIAQAVRTCSKYQIPYLTYGKFHYGKARGDSLSYFKEVNGFRRVDVPRYYIPVTFTGALAFRLGLHHRFVDYLPEAVVTKLRNLRNAWYDGKFLPAKEN